MRQAGEPSVEEILESIKQVIARDNRDGAAAERQKRETAGMAKEATPKPDSSSKSEDADGEILELGEIAEIEEESAAVDDSALTRPDAAQSMRESLAALAMMSEPSAPPQIVRSGETSLEGLVREMLRPMLAQWLDDNLPEMVERLVKNEISRIAGKQG